MYRTVGVQAGAGEATLRRRACRCSSDRRPRTTQSEGLRVMKDRVGRQRNLMPTGCALPASLLCQFVGISVPAARTHEAVRPATSGQILPAGFFARKICLKFAQSLRKRRPRHPTTLHLVACLNNRISRSWLATCLRQMFSYKFRLIAVSAKCLLVNCECLLQQRNARSGLTGFVHKHPEIRNVRCRFRAVRRSTGRPATAIRAASRSRAA